MNRKTALVAVLIGAATAAQAQVAITRSDNTAAAKPALVSDSTIRANDSPLVRAAKQTLAARKKTAAGGSYVIDNMTVRRSTTTLSTSSGIAPLPDYSSEQAPAARMGGQQPNADTQALQQRAAALQQEMLRRQESLDQGPFSEGTEDRDVQRMTQATQDLNRINTTLQTPTATPPPPVTPPYSTTQPPRP